MTRAYATEFGVATDWQESVNCLEPLLRPDCVTVQAWETEVTPLWQRPTILVLYGPHTRIGAIDLESKFTEAALAHIKIADYRNFAHGRHHWLAKRSEESAVLAFVTKEDRVIAERTLDLIPDEVPKAKIQFTGGPSSTGLASVLAALRLTGWAGRQRDIDPGRPGVPTFGRKLYHLTLPRHRGAPNPLRLTRREAAAIRRKAGLDIETLAASGELGRWRDALVSFLKRLRAASFAGIVVDYDGTVVDTRHRRLPATAVMATELTRVIEGNARVAVATGRGASVRRDLRKCLPPALWSRVLVGYYNGAEVAFLDDDSVPDGQTTVCDALQPIADALRRQPELATYVCQEDRRYQITLQAERLIPIARLWDLACSAVALAGVRSVGITRSSHSIDIVASGVSKLNGRPQIARNDRRRAHSCYRRPWSLAWQRLRLAA